LTDTPEPTLQRMFQRHHIMLQPCDVPLKGCGDRGLSIRRILQIAITTELSLLGIGPSRGGKAAFEFTDKGNAGRAVGELYPIGRTVLVGLPRGESKVVNIPPDLFQMYCQTTAQHAVVAKVTEKLSKAE
jgi:hypothetical protein